MKRIGLLSDTHGFLDKRVVHHLSEVDEIWHAGDIGDIAVTDVLEQVAPLRAVYGNIDNHVIRATHPLNRRFVLEGVNVWLTHIGGYPGNYSPPVRQSIYKHPPDLFISGHSHILKVMRDKKLNLLHMNPGAAGNHGFQKVRTLLRFSLNKGRIEDLEVVELGPKNFQLPNAIHTSD